MGFSNGNDSFTMPVVPMNNGGYGNDGFGFGGGMGQGYSYNDPYYMHESMRHRNALGQYAHHSTNDKMIAALENTITPDMTDMERQRVMEQIRMIRERKD